MKKQQGFTLIELLVVIAIIGLLSTLAVLSFGGVREKARDSQRLSDVKQLSTILEIEESNNAGTTLAGCVYSAGADNSELTTACNNTDTEITQFDKFIDPSAVVGAVGTGTELCHDAAADTTAIGPCRYSIKDTAGTGTAKTNDYEICFYMESASTLGASGYYTITTGGVMSPTPGVAVCP